MPSLQNPIEITDELSKRLADSFGGPLSTNDIERMKNDPNSILNKAAAGYVAKVFNDEMSLWNRIVMWLQELRRDVTKGVKTEVTDASDDLITASTTPAHSSTTGHSLKEIPLALQNLQKSLLQLQAAFLGCCLQLAANQVVQRNAFNQAIQQLPNYRQLGLRPLSETDDAVLTKMYADTHKNIETVARPEDKQQPGRMDAQALLNFELKMARYVSSTEDDEDDVHLSPQMVRQAQAAFKAYLQYAQANYQIEQQQQVIRIEMIRVQVQIVQGFPRDLIDAQLQGSGNNPLRPNPFNMSLTRGGNGK